MTAYAAQELLSLSVRGASLLQSLAQRVQQCEQRCRLLAQRVSTAAAVPLREVVFCGCMESRKELEKNNLLLLAECLYFAACLHAASRDELRALLAALASLAPALAAPGGPRSEQSTAHAVLFAALAALERVRPEDVAAALADDFFRAAQHGPLQSILRLALALASPAGGGDQLLAACDDGVFAALLAVVHSPLRLPDYYITAHTLVDAFLDDRRGREQVKHLLDSNQVAFGHLLLLLAQLYGEGPDDLPQQCQPLWDFVDLVAEEFQKSAERSPTMLMGMLKLLRALARTQPDEVWARLHSRSVSLVGDVVVAAMLEYRNLFVGEDAGAAFGQARFMFQEQLAVAPREIAMAAEDVDALVAYLRVLTQFVDDGELTKQRVQQLESKLNQPLIFFLFTLLDFPVVPRLKAALFDAIGAFATDPVAAATVWSLLEAAAVIQKPQEGGMEGYGAEAPKLDISFQLNEIESREETYPETLAFLRLVNKLLQLCSASQTGPAAGSGAAVAHVFQFVRDTVFLCLDRRTYRDVSEKWRLATACQTHFQALLKLAQQGQSAPEAARFPGLELLLDFDNEGPVVRRVLSALSGGVDRLDQEAQQAHGGELELCVAEALELLLSAFALGLGGQGAQPLTRLDVLLLRDRRRVADIFSYVRHARNSQLQTAAVRLVHAIAARNERMAATLDPSTAQQLKLDLAEALRADLQATFCAGKEAPQASAALAIQQLLLATIKQSAAPGLGHLLLGFEQPSEAGALSLEPTDSPSALTVLLGAARPLPEGATDMPAALSAQERTYEILCALASDRRTAAATVERLRAVFHLPAALEAAAARYEQTSSAARASLQHLRAWLVRLATVVLHEHSDASSLLDGDASILRTLFAGDPEDRSTCAMLQLLQAADWSSEPPALALPYAQGLTEIGLQGVLAPDKLARAGAHACLRVDRGEKLFNVAALELLLRQRFAQIGQQPDGDFLQTVLQYAVRVNDWKREAAAAKCLLAAWNELACLVVSRRYLALRAALDEEPGAVTEAVVVLLFAALKLLPTADDARCTLLLRVSHAMLEKLSTDTSDCQSGVTGRALPPSSCHQIMHALILAMLRSDRSDATRHSAYASLLALLRLCRPPQWAHSPAVLSLLQGISASELADVSGEMQRELDAGILAELRLHSSALLNVLARDALSGFEQPASLSALRPIQSLAILEALLGVAEGSGAALEAPLFSSRLPAAVAATLQGTPRSALLLPSPKCRLVLDTMEAQLSFLLAVARYTPSGATHLVACGVVLHLAGCPVLDALPEESTEACESVRQAVLVPALQVVAALLQLLPDSIELGAQASAFVIAHQDALLRVLGAREREWKAGHQLQATLVALQLLCPLCVRLADPALARFREALERLCWHFFEAEVPWAVASPVFLVQGVLAVYLRRLVVSKRALMPVQCGREGAVGRSGTPTLQLVAGLLRRLTGALGDSLRARHELAMGLADGASSRGAESMLLDAGGEGHSLPAAAAELALVDSDTRTLLHALENALEAVHATLVAAFAAGLGAREAEALVYLLQPVCDDLARYQDDTACDWGFLKLLLRRVPQLLEEEASR